MKLQCHIKLLSTFAINFNKRRYSTVAYTAAVSTFAEAAVVSTKVWRCRMKVHASRVESAWCRQRLQLKYDTLVSTFDFNFDLRRYSEGSAAATMTNLVTAVGVTATFAVTAIGRCRLKPVERRVESVWFQLLKLNCDEVVENFAFNLNLRRYTAAPVTAVELDLVVAADTTAGGSAIEAAFKASVADSLVNLGISSSVGVSAVGSFVGSSNIPPPPAPPASSAASGPSGPVGRTAVALLAGLAAAALALA